MAEYTTLSDVKTILRSATRDRVHFSDDGLTQILINNIDNASTPNLKRNVSVNFDLIFDETKLIYSDNFFGNYKLMIAFTSPTAYNVYKSQGADPKWRSIGTGTISTTFVTPDGYVTIPDTCWSGTIVANAAVELIFQIDVSDNDAEEFIEFAEMCVDLYLEDMQVAYRDSDEYNTWQSSNVPKEIKKASAYYAAYVIYTNAFSDEDKDDMKGHFSKRWLKQAEKTLDFMVKRLGRHAPLINGLPPARDHIGLDDIAAGEATKTTTRSILTRDPKSKELERKTYTSGNTELDDDSEI